VLAATLLALPELGSNSRDLFGTLDFGWPLAAFVIAMAGWMPMPLSGSIFLSMWAREKKATSSVAIGHKAALTDLRFGWILTVVLAVCFVLLGAAILFQTERVAPSSAGEFATELMSIFTSAIGAWSYPLIAIAAIAVMWSGVFALMDALPRVSARLIDHITGRADDGAARYSTFLMIQLAGVTLILLFLMSNFGTFIDFATSAGFISAPALAYFNYRAVTSAEIATRYQPTRSLLVWHWIGFAAMTFFAVAFLITKAWR